MNEIMASWTRRDQTILWLNEPIPCKFCNSCHVLVSNKNGETQCFICAGKKEGA